MAREKVYDYERIDRRKEAQDDWYLQRRREIREEDDAIQTKLEISQPGDQHEQEADVIAKKVAGGGNASGNKITPVNNTVQTKSEDNSLQVSPELSSSLNNSKGSGQQLNDSTKTEMESKIGTDLSGVKIHTGSEAHEMNDSINAKAFTHGQDIYFKQGNYNPSSNTGKELLAHELVHTQQQGNGVSRKVQRVYDWETEVQPGEKDKIDKVAKEVSVILGFESETTIVNDFNAVNATSSSAIEAYQLLQKELLPDEITHFIKYYPNLWYEIDENLPVEFRKGPGFGFFQGVSEDEKIKIENLLRDDSTWQDAELLGLVLDMTLDAYREINYQNNTVNIPAGSKIAGIIQFKLGQHPDMSGVVSQHGFSSDGSYSKENVPEKISKGYKKSRLSFNLFKATYTRGALGYAGKGYLKTLGSGLLNLVPWTKTLHARGVSLAYLQQSFAGNLGGIEFVDKRKANGKVDRHAVEGKLDVDVDFRKGSARFYGAKLPFASMNYQMEDGTFRSGAGFFDGLTFSMDWETAEGEKNGQGTMKLHIDDMALNAMRMIYKDETFGIGFLGLKGLDLVRTQNFGPTSGYSDMAKFLSVSMTLLLDTLSFTSYAMSMSMYRFTSPVNSDALKDRQKTTELLADFMRQGYFQGLDIVLKFDSLELRNFVYLDKDLVKDDFGNETFADSQQLTPNASVIKSIKTGKTEIHIDTVGSPSVSQLQEAKIKLNKNIKELDQKKADKVFYTNEKEKLNADRKKIVDAGGTGRTDKKKLSQIDKKLLLTDEKLKKIDSDIEQLQKNITEQQGIVDNLQSGMAIHMKMTANDVETSTGGMLDELGSGMVTSFSTGVEGVGGSSAKNLTYETTFSPASVTNTTLSATELTIPLLKFNNIFYAKEDNSFSMSALDAKMQDVKGTFRIEFRDMNIGQQGSGSEALVLSNKLKTLDQQIASKKTEIEFEKSRLTIVSSTTDLDILTADLNQLELDKTTTQEEYDKATALIAAIYLTSFEVPTITVSGLGMFFGENKNRLDFPADVPITLSGLSVSNIKLIFDDSGKMLLPEPADGTSQGDIKLASTTVPAGTKLISNNTLQQVTSEVDFSKIIAGVLDIQVLGYKNYAYSLASLSGEGILKQFDANNKTRESKFQLPGAGNNTDSPLLSGTMVGNKLTASLYQPSIILPYLDWDGTETKISTPANDKPVILNGITLDIEAELNSDPNAPNQFTTFTILLGKIDTLESQGLNIKHKEKIFNVPDTQPALLNGIFLTNMKMESSVEENQVTGQQQVSWNRVQRYGEGLNGKIPLDMSAGLTSMNIPLGIQSTLGNTIDLLIKKTHSGLIRFEWLSTGGIGYRFEDLFVEGEYTKEDDSGNVTQDLKGSVDSRVLSGTYLKTSSGTGIDQKDTITITGNIDIPEIKTKRLFIQSSDSLIDIPENTEESYLKNITATFETVIITPSEREKQAAQKKALDAKNKLFNMPKILRTKKIEEQLLAESKLEAKPDVSVTIKKLNMEQMVAWGLHLKITTKSTVTDLNNLGADYNEDVYELQVRKDASAIVNNLVVEDFKLHLPKEEKDKVSFSAKNISVGGTDASGTSTIGLTLGVSDIISENMRKALGGGVLDKTSYGATVSLSASKISFGGSNEGEFTITINDPNIWLPQDTGDEFSNFRFRQFKDKPDRINQDGSITYHDTMVTGGFNAFGQEDAYYKELFSAGSIEISRRKVYWPGPEPRIPKLDADHKEQYQVTTRIKNPVLHDIEFIIENHTSQAGETSFSKLILGGSVNGTLLIGDEEDVDFAEVPETYKTDKSSSLVIKGDPGDLDNPDPTVTFTSAKIETTTTPPKLSQSQLDIKHNQQDANIQNLPQNDTAMIADYDKQKKAEKRNQFDFLDAASGTITVSMFDKNEVINIESVKGELVNFKGWFDDGTANEEKTGKSIDAMGYVDLKTAIENLSNKLEGDLEYPPGSGIKVSKLKNNPYYALTTLTAGIEDDNYYVQTWRQDDTGKGTMNLDILVPHSNQNVAVLANTGGRELVKLSALMDFITYRKSVHTPSSVWNDFKKSFTDPAMNEALEDFTRLLNSGFFQLNIQVNAQVDLAKLKDKDPNEQAKKRGLLSILQNDQVVDINLGAKPDPEPTTGPGPLQKKSGFIITTGKIDLGTFRAPLKDKKTQKINLLISGESITADQAVIEPLDELNVTLPNDQGYKDYGNNKPTMSKIDISNLQIKGFRIDSRKKKKGK